MSHWQAAELIKGKDREIHNNVNSKDDSKQMSGQRGWRTIRKDLGHQRDETRRS